MAEWSSVFAEAWVQIPPQRNTVFLKNYSRYLSYKPTVCIKDLFNLKYAILGSTQLLQLPLLPRL